MSTAITVCEYEPEEILSIVRQAEVLYGQGMAMPVALAAGEPLLVPQRIKGPLRRVPLFVRHIPVRLRDRVDNAGEALLHRPPNRCRPAAARTRRIVQHLLHRPGSMLNRHAAL